MEDNEQTRSNTDNNGSVALSNPNTTDTNNGNIVSEIKNNENTKRVPAAGFNVHPENINRNGRPRRDWTWSDLIQDAVEEYVPLKDGGKIQAKKAIVKRLIHMAVNGDMQAVKEMIDRMDGKAKQNLDLTTQGEKFTINIDGLIGLSKTATETTAGNPDAVQPKV